MAPLITNRADPARAAQVFEPSQRLGHGRAGGPDRADGGRRCRPSPLGGGDRARHRQPDDDPGAAGGVWQTDIRPVLPTIRQPTIVLHCTHDRTVSVRHGREAAALIPDARLVEMPGQDHYVWVDPHASAMVLDEIAQLLTGARRLRPSDRALATLVFTDIVGSTAHASEIGDQRWARLLAQHHLLTGDIVRGHRGRVVKSLGDGALASFDGPARAVRAACALQEAVQPLGVRLRVGVHTGECELLDDHDVGGIAVHIGSRIAQLAEPGDVLVSSTVRDLVAGSGIEFSDRGLHALKGIPERWHLLSVVHP